MIYELKIFVKIVFLKLFRIFVSLISYGKKLNFFAPRKAKALCPVASLHFHKRSAVKPKPIVT